MAFSDDEGWAPIYPFMKRYKRMNKHQIQPYKHIKNPHQSGVSSSSDVVAIEI